MMQIDRKGQPEGILRLLFLHSRPAFMAAGFLDNFSIIWFYNGNRDVKIRKKIKG